MNFRKLIITSAALSMSACSFGPHKPIISESQGIRIFSTAADSKSAYMKDHGSKERYCAARQADAADTNSVGMGLGYGVESASEQASQGALGLGGRSPSVLITRELMFRACELTMNLNLSKEEALSVYSTTMNALVTISRTQTENGVGSVAASTSSGSPAVSPDQVGNQVDDMGNPIDDSTQYDASPYVTSQDGTVQDGAVQGGAIPNATVPNATVQDGNVTNANTKSTPAPKNSPAESFTVQ